MEKEKRGCNAEDDKVPNVSELEAMRKRLEEETDKPQATSENGELQASEGGGKPTFICAIYRQDILSFLPRSKIEKMRTLSQQWNYDISTSSPAILPRVVYNRLEVLIGEGDGYRLTKEGYVRGRDRSKVIVDIGGQAIQRESNNFRTFSRCCQEIREKAGQELNGQLVFPHLDARDVVVVRLETNGSLPVFRAPNKLTVETAGTLIHFLSHIDESCVHRLKVQPGLPDLSDERGEPIRALNPQIFDVYRAAVQKPLRLYACGVETEAVPINATWLRTARQLVVKFRNVVTTEEEQLQVANRPATRGLRRLLERQHLRHQMDLANVERKLLRLEVDYAEKRAQRWKRMSLHLLCLLFIFALVICVLCLRKAWLEWNSQTSFTMVPVKDAHGVITHFEMIREATVQPL